jgi:hypothetical protein
LKEYQVRKVGRSGIPQNSQSENEIITEKNIILFLLYSDDK